MYYGLGNLRINNQETDIDEVELTFELTPVAEITSTATNKVKLATNVTRTSFIVKLKLSLLTRLTSQDNLLFSGYFYNTNSSQKLAFESTIKLTESVNYLATGYYNYEFICINPRFTELQ